MHADGRSKFDDILWLAVAAEIAIDLHESYYIRVDGRDASRALRYVATARCLGIRPYAVITDDLAELRLALTPARGAIRDSATSLQQSLHLFSTRANALHIIGGLAERRAGTAQPIKLEELAALFATDARG